MPRKRRNRSKLLDVSPPPTAKHKDGTKQPPSRTMRRLVFTQRPPLLGTARHAYIKRSFSNPSSSSIMTDTNSTNLQPTHPADASVESAKQPLALSPPPADGDAHVTQLDVNGQGVKLDHLGPMVVNRDGTLSRIANWEHMAEIERQNTLRILGKRNQLRREALRGGQGEGGGSAA
jgi:hypothetical protein